MIEAGDLVFTPAPKGCWDHQPLGDVMSVDNLAGTALVRRDNHLDDGAGRIDEVFSLDSLKVAISAVERRILRETEAV